MKNLTLPLFSANSSLDRAFMQSESSDWFAFWLHGSKHYPVYLLSKQGAFWSSTPNLVSLTSRRDCTSLCKSYCPGNCLRVRTEPVIIISGFLRSHAEAVWLSLEGWGLVRRQLLGNWHYKDTAVSDIHYIAAVANLLHHSFYSCSVHPSRGVI